MAGALERITERNVFGVHTPILHSVADCDKSPSRFLHILTGDGPDWLYHCRGQFDLLNLLAPPTELLDALEKQAKRGTVPPATLAWVTLWREVVK